MKKYLVLLVAVSLFAYASPTDAYSTTDGNKISITSPNGGEVYRPGDTVPIRWTSTVQNFQTTITYVNIYKLKGTGWDPLAPDYNVYINQNEPYELTPIKNSGFKDTGKLDWTISNYWNAPGNYVAYVSVSYWNDPSDPKAGIQTDWSEGYFTITSASQTNGARPVGTNVKGTDGTVYRITEGGFRRPYTSAGAFLSYKFNSWAGVADINNTELAFPTASFIPPRNGSLINDKGTIYLITDGLRIGFASEPAFLGMGYSYANVSAGDTSFMNSLPPINSAYQKHPNGTLINVDGTLYVMQNGYRVGFPNMSTLDSWGYSLNETVYANSYDREATVNGVLQPRLANQLSI